MWIRRASLRTPPCPRIRYPPSYCLRFKNGSPEASHSRWGHRWMSRHLRKSHQMRRILLRIWARSLKIIIQSLRWNPIPWEAGSTTYLSTTILIQSRYSISHPLWTGRHSMWPTWTWTRISRCQLKIQRKPFKVRSWAPLTIFKL